MAYAGICLTDDLQAALRPVLLRAQPAGDLDLHVVEPGRDQRGADGLAAALRRRQRGAGRDVRPGLRADGDDPAAQPRDRRRAERHPARRRGGDRQHRHDLDRAAAAHAPGRRHGHDRRRGASPATTARSRSPSVPTHAVVHRTRTRSRACRPRAAARSRSPRRARPSPATRSRSAPSRPHNRSVGDVVDDLGRRRRRLQRHVHDHRRADAAHVPVHEPDRRPRQLGRRHDDVLLAVQGPDRRQRLGRDRRQRPALHERQPHAAINAHRRASPARRRSPARPRPASRSPTRGAAAGIDVPNFCSSTSAAAAASPRSRRRTTAARTTRSRSTTTATSRRRS